MLSSLKDMLQLLGFSVFEVWLQVTALIVFLVLLCLKVNSYCMLILFLYCVS